MILRAQSQWGDLGARQSQLQKQEKEANDPCTLPILQKGNGL